MVFRLINRIVLGDLKLRAPYCDENRCVFCRSYGKLDLKGGLVPGDSGCFYQLVRCEECEKTWLDEYEMMPLNSTASYL